MIFYINNLININFELYHFSNKRCINILYKICIHFSSVISHQFHVKLQSGIERYRKHES